MILFYFYPVCEQDFDLVFVIDGSGSIDQVQKGNFDKVREFIKQIIDGFEISEERTHVGAIVFSSKQWVKTIFHLKQEYSKDRIYSKIDKMTYPRGGTNTGKALGAASNMFRKGDRPDKPNVCIVVTDGRADDDIRYNAKALKKTGTPGTKVFAVGVGGNFDRSELEAMASKPAGDFVFAADFDKLDEVTQKIKDSACVGELYACYFFIFLQNCTTILAQFAPVRVKGEHTRVIRAQTPRKTPDKGNTCSISIVDFMKI